MRRDFLHSVRSTFGRRVWRLMAGSLALASLVSSGCTNAQLSGESPSYVILDRIDAASGASSAEFSNTLGSDIVTNGGVLEDIGRVSLRLALKDPGSADSPSQPSTTNYITLTRYHVEYVRADGRNTAGVHVPYPFDGAFTATAVPAGATATFVLVRVQAKLEPPLIALRGLGGSVAISTLAVVTFYGHDQAGREVSAQGSISVNFADWADPEGN